MKRIMVVCPNPDDATSYYRGVGPFARLQRDIEDLSLIFVSEVKWATVCMADIVFMQRPFASAHVQAANIAKTYGIPLWVDFDDDLLDVGPENPTFYIYGKPDIRKNVATLAAMADIVTVSTDHLGSKIKSLNPNVVVVPNALDDCSLRYRRERPTPREKLVFWRGGPTHQKDLMWVEKQLVDISHDSEFKDWTFQFHGFNPWWITQLMREKHTIVSEAIDVLEYMRFLEQLNPAIMIVPLHPNNFNLSKSNCSWLEGSFAGAAVLATDLPEFRQPGIVRFKTPDEFAIALREMMRGKWDLEAQNHQAFEHIREELCLTKVNKEREKIVDHLMAVSRSTW